MSKKNSYLTLITIAVNLLTYFSLVPYVQTTANSHMNSGAFFGTSYYLISGLLLIFALNRLLKQKDYKLFIILHYFCHIKLFQFHQIQYLSLRSLAHFVEPLITGSNARSAKMVEISRKDSWQLPFPFETFPA